MKIQTLNGNWQLNKTGDTLTSYPARVPGCVHTDLLAADALPDPLYRDHEKQQKWIGEADWTYQRTFEVDDALLAHDTVRLRFHGLDTIATVRINGTELGRTENMFRTYEFDVRDALKAGENLIAVDFTSPMQYSRHMDETMGEMAGWVEPMRVSTGAWMRKEPCNFGWDWGPKMPTVGIWRDVELVAFNTARLADVHILQDHHNDHVTLTVKTAVESLNNAPLTARVEVTFAGEIVAEATGLVVEQGTAEATLSISDPHLWWVNSLGDQPLYDVRVQLMDGNHLLDENHKRIGLRVLRLQTPEDEWGQAMYFTCNGVKFFAKGANWIPVSPYPAEPTREDIDVFVKAADDANMNMLRVWGGGIYEDDAFYELCDEYGIAVWQDFMFACGTYPSANEDWMANVRQEAIENVQRIRHHACLALWCGNNEIEQGMMYGEWEKVVPWDVYDLLFRDLLGGVVAEYAPQSDYWPSSPHSPLDRHNVEDQRSGDTHAWAVWHGRQPFEYYRTRQDRFLSEFGFQSFPEPATVNEFTAPEDRNITSYVMEYRQRSQIGNATIIHYMLDWYQLPTSFDNMLWLSQILQGMAMKYAVEHWRRNMPRTMGTLYWQINDMWGAPSWASMDWRGRWKALHYMAKRFYSPLLVSGVENLTANTVDVHITSDRLEDVAAEVAYTVTDIAGKEISSGKLDAVAHANGNTHVTQLDFSEQVAAHAKRNLLIWLELVVDGELVSENLVMLVRPKHMALLNPQLSLTIEPVHDNVYDITITGQAPALSAWLDLPDAQFSDNFVDLPAQQPKTIRMIAPDGMDAAQVREALSVKSLYDTYQ